MHFKIIRAISTALIICFLGQDLAMASPEVRPWALGQTPKLPFILPTTVASLEDGYQAPRQKDVRHNTDGSSTGQKTNKIVYLLQDAHTNESGQLNLSKTLESIFKNTGAETVFIEGGSGDDSISYLRQFGSAPERKRLAESLLKQGLLQGEEYLGITSELNFKTWGVEDFTLYREAIESYKIVAKQRGAFENYLNRVDAAIKILKPRLYSPRLLDFDAARQNYQNGTLPLTDYIHILSAYARFLEISLYDYPHLKRLKALKVLEAKIDFEKASSEKSRDEKSPEFKKYLGYVKATSKIKPDKILSEQQALEEAVLRALTEADHEKSLLACDQQLFYLRKLSRFALSPEEYEVYRKNAERWNAAEITGFLNRKIADAGDYYENALLLESGFSTVVAEAEKFYGLTLKRDEAFLKNMLAQWDGSKPAVLVAGGFHAPNLKSLFKKEGISFYSIRPQVYRETNQKRYEEILLGQSIQETPTALPQSMARVGSLLNDATRFGQVIPRVKSIRSKVSAARLSEQKTNRKSWNPMTLKHLLRSVKVRIVDQRDRWLGLFFALKNGNNSQGARPSTKNDLDKLMGGARLSTTFEVDKALTDAVVAAWTINESEAQKFKDLNVRRSAGYYILDGPVCKILTIQNDLAQKIASFHPEAYGASVWIDDLKQTAATQGFIILQLKYDGYDGRLYDQVITIRLSPEGFIAFVRRLYDADPRIARAFLSKAMPSNAGGARLAAKKFSSAPLFSGLVAALLMAGAGCNDLMKDLGLKSNRHSTPFTSAPEPNTQPRAPTPTPTAFVPGPNLVADVRNPEQDGTVDIVFDLTELQKLTDMQAVRVLCTHTDGTVREEWYGKSKLIQQSGILRINLLIVHASNGRASILGDWRVLFSVWDFPTRRFLAPYVIDSGRSFIVNHETDSASPPPYLPSGLVTGVQTLNTTQGASSHFEISFDSALLQTFAPDEGLQIRFENVNDGTFRDFYTLPVTLLNRNRPLELDLALLTAQNGRSVSGRWNVSVRSHTFNQTTSLWTDTGIVFDVDFSNYGNLLLPRLPASFVNAIRNPGNGAAGEIEFDVNEVSQLPAGSVTVKVRFRFADGTYRDEFFGRQSILNSVTGIMPINLAALNAEGGAATVGPWEVTISAYDSATQTILYRFTNTGLVWSALDFTGGARLAKYERRFAGNIKRYRQDLAPALDDYFKRLNDMATFKENVIGSAAALVATHLFEINTLSGREIFKRIDETHEVLSPLAEMREQADRLGQDRAVEDIDSIYEAMRAVDAISNQYTKGARLGIQTKYLRSETVSLIKNSPIDQIGHILARHLEVEGGFHEASVENIRESVRRFLVNESVRSWLAVELPKLVKQPAAEQDYERNLVLQVFKPASKTDGEAGDQGFQIDAYAHFFNPAGGSTKLHTHVHPALVVTLNDSFQEQMFQFVGPTAQKTGDLVTLTAVGEAQKLPAFSVAWVKAGDEHLHRISGKGVILEFYIRDFNLPTTPAFLYEGEEDVKTAKQIPFARGARLSASSSVKKPKVMAERMAAYLAPDGALTKDIWVFTDVQGVVRVGEGSQDQAQKNARELTDPELSAIFQRYLARSGGLKLKKGLHRNTLAKVLYLARNGFKDSSSATRQTRHYSLEKISEDPAIIEIGPGQSKDVSEPSHQEKLEGRFSEISRLIKERQYGLAAQELIDLRRHLVQTTADKSWMSSWHELNFQAREHRIVSGHGARLTGEPLGVTEALDDYLTTVLSHYKSTPTEMTLKKLDWNRIVFVQVAYQTSDYRIDGLRAWIRVTQEILRARLQNETQIQAEIDEFESLAKRIARGRKLDPSAARLAGNKLLEKINQLQLSKEQRHALSNILPIAELARREARVSKIALIHGFYDFGLGLGEELVDVWPALYKAAVADAFGVDASRVDSLVLDLAAYPSPERVLMYFQALEDLTEALRKYLSMPPAGARLAETPDQETWKDIVRKMEDNLLKSLSRVGVTKEQADQIVQMVEESLSEELRRFYQIAVGSLRMYRMKNSDPNIDKELDDRIKALENDLKDMGARLASEDRDKQKAIDNARRYVHTKYVAGGYTTDEELRRNFPELNEKQLRSILNQNVGFRDTTGARLAEGQLGESQMLWAQVANLIAHLMATGEFKTRVFYQIGDKHGMMNLARMNPTQVKAEMMKTAELAEIDLDETYFVEFDDAGQIRIVDGARLSNRSPFRNFVVKGNIMIGMTALGIAAADVWSKTTYFYHNGLGASHSGRDWMLFMMIVIGGLCVVPGVRLSNWLFGFNQWEITPSRFKNLSTGFLVAGIIYGTAFNLQKSLINLDRWPELTFTAVLLSWILHDIRDQYSNLIGLTLVKPSSVSEGARLAKPSSRLSRAVKPVHRNKESKDSGEDPHRRGVERQAASIIRTAEIQLNTASKRLASADYHGAQDLLDRTKESIKSITKPHDSDRKRLAQVLDKAHKLDQTLSKHWRTHWRNRNFPAENTGARLSAIEQEVERQWGYDSTPLALIGDKYEDRIREVVKDYAVAVVSPHNVPTVPIDGDALSYAAVMIQRLADEARIQGRKMILTADPREIKDDAENFYVLLMPLSDQHKGYNDNDKAAFNWPPNIRGKRALFVGDMRLSVPLDYLRKGDFGFDSIAVLDHHGWPEALVKLAQSKQKDPAFIFAHTHSILPARLDPSLYPAGAFQSDAVSWNPDRLGEESSRKYRFLKILSIFSDKYEKNYPQLIQNVDDGEAKKAGDFLNFFGTFLMGWKPAPGIDAELAKRQIILEALKVILDASSFAGLNQGLSALADSKFGPDFKKISEDVLREGSRSIEQFKASSDPVFFYPVQSSTDVTLFVHKLVFGQLDPLEGYGERVFGHYWINPANGVINVMLARNTSFSKVNLKPIVLALGGGGHDMRAGFNVPLSDKRWNNDPQNVLNYLRQEIQKQLNPTEESGARLADFASDEFRVPFAVSVAGGSLVFLALTVFGPPLEYSSRPGVLLLSFAAVSAISASVIHLFAWVAYERFGKNTFPPMPRLLSETNKDGLVHWAMHFSGNGQYRKIIFYHNGRRSAESVIDLSKSDWRQALIARVTLLDERYEYAIWKTGDVLSIDVVPSGARLAGAVSRREFMRALAAFGLGQMLFNAGCASGGGSSQTTPNPTPTPTPTPTPFVDPVPPAHLAHVKYTPVSQIPIGHTRYTYFARPGEEGGLVEAFRVNANTVEFFAPKIGLIAQNSIAANGHSINPSAAFGRDNWNKTFDFLFTGNNAQRVKDSGANTIKVNVHPDNLTTAARQELADNILRLHQQFGIRTEIMLWSGLYARRLDANGNVIQPEKFLLNQPGFNAALQEHDLETIKRYTRELASTLAPLGKAVAGIQIGNENAYHVFGAYQNPQAYFGGQNFSTITLTPTQYYEFMAELALEYRAIDATHTLAFGHGYIEPAQVAQMRSANIHVVFDKISLNLYPFGVNLQSGGQIPAGLDIDTVIRRHQESVNLAVKDLGLPVGLGETGFESRGLSNASFADFIAKMTQGLAKLMAYGGLDVATYPRNQFPVGGLVGFYGWLLDEYWKANEGIPGSELGLWLFVLTAPNTYDPAPVAKPAFQAFSREAQALKSGQFANIPTSVISPARLAAFEPVETPIILPAGRSFEEVMQGPSPFEPEVDKAVEELDAELAAEPALREKIRQFIAGAAKHGVFGKEKREFSFETRKAQRRSAVFSVYYDNDITFVSFMGKSMPELGTVNVSEKFRPQKSADKNAANLFLMKQAAKATAAITTSLDRDALKGCVNIPLNRLSDEFEDDSEFEAALSFLRTDLLANGGNVVLSGRSFLKPERRRLVSRLIRFLNKLEPRVQVYLTTPENTLSTRLVFADPIDGSDKETLLQGLNLQENEMAVFIRTGKNIIPNLSAGLGVARGLSNDATPLFEKTGRAPDNVKDASVPEYGALVEKINARYLEIWTRFAVAQASRRSAQDAIDVATGKNAELIEAFMFKPLMEIIGSRLAALAEMTRRVQVCA